MRRWGCDLTHNMRVRYTYNGAYIHTDTNRRIWTANTVGNTQRMLISRQNFWFSVSYENAQKNWLPLWALFFKLNSVKQTKYNNKYAVRRILCVCKVFVFVVFAVAASSSFAAAFCASVSWSATALGHKLKSFRYAQVPYKCKKLWQIG